MTWFLITVVYEQWNEKPLATTVLTPLTYK